MVHRWKTNGKKRRNDMNKQTEKAKMTYRELKEYFCNAEKQKRHVTGFIVFSQESFTKPYTEEQRTYEVSSDNKAFLEGMGGYSIFGTSLDGSDICVRLDAYMLDEKGGPDGWKVEYCYLKEIS